jgi:hypothetical protein
MALTPLEQTLVDLAHDDPRELAVRLERAKDSARRIWKTPRMPWFTDHTPDNHSRRIVYLLSETLEHLQTTPERLRPVELFILLAACYLHDIGMQDMKKNGMARQEFTEAEWALVRNDHPGVVKEWIVTRTRASDLTQFRIDIGDAPEPYLEILGLVCQGHGSRYFGDTVAELERITDTFDGDVVRGALLTALLMMTDEFDISQERAGPPKEENREPVGELHHTLNSCTTSVRVGRGNTDKERRATIEMSMATEEPTLPDLICEWLGRKVSAQARRVNAVVETATNGELKYDETIVFRVRADTFALRPVLSARGRALLEQEIRHGDIVRRQEVLTRLAAALNGREALSAAVVLESTPHGDHTPILRWLESAIYVREGVHCIVPCRREGGRGPLDVLDIVAESLGSHAAQYATERGRIDEDSVDTAEIERICEALASDIVSSAAARPIVLDVRHIDQAAPETRDIVLALAVATQLGRPAPLLVFTVDSDTLPASLDRIVFPLADFKSEEIASHLEDVCGFAETRASAEAAALYAVGGAPRWA